MVHKRPRNGLVGVHIQRIALINLQLSNPTPLPSLRSCPFFRIPVFDRDFSLALLIQLPPEIGEFSGIVSIEPLIISEICTAKAAVKFAILEDIILFVPS